ncbi:MAG: M23 family metallopeptidase, partial [Oscillospiraceae bacterium]|nr:M23 family metallopeptidase [Oscillospiraceae bacterium]
AADGGTVIEAGWNDGGYGNFVMIDHGNGYITLYGHASEVFVNPGDTVSKGDLIAAVGTTGDSTGNHWHFAGRVNGGFLNPEDFI